MIVLDTHVWVWWVDDHPRLNPAVREQIDRASVKIVSAISFFEITIAASINRLTLSPTPESWFTIAESADGLRVEPLTSQTCLAARRLPGEFHRDPGDQIIVALARELDAPLVTADARILRYAHVRALRAD